MKPKKGRVKEAFNSFSSKYVAFIEERYILQAQMKAINHILKFMHGKVLEVAVGTGIIAIELAKSANAEIYGIDISEKMLGIAEEKAKKEGVKLNLHLGDAENIEFGDNTFDVVLECTCLNHVQDKFKVLSELGRVCKDEGTIILMEDEGVLEIEREQPDLKTSLGRIKSEMTIIQPEQIKELTNKLNYTLIKEFREEISPGHNLLTMVFTKT